MNAALPTTIPEYLDRLRAALAGADPALVQDALYDAEEYLRSELSENSGQSEAEVIAAVASSYGAPDEVADIYRDTEAKVQTALKPPAPPKRKSALGRFFGVVADPRTYASLFYMVLALATGIFYFTWVVTGLSLSLGLAITIVGIPLLILFFGSVRILSLVEGRLVEVMLGERMPRRPLYADREQPLLERIKELFTDPRMWSTLFYLLLMLPLGVVYFTLVVTLLTLSLTFILSPFALLPGIHLNVWMFGFDIPEAAPWLLPVLSVIGVVLLFVSLHVVRLIGRWHGTLAKHLLVKA
jgi:uncharacterized membrane protein